MEEIIVQPFSSEWIYVSFRLQLLLAHPNIEIVSLRKRQCKFASAYDSFLKIEAAVDITDVDTPTVTSIKNSLKKDLVLKAGRISQIRDNPKQPIDKKYRVLLMKMAILQILPTLKQPCLTSEDLLLHHPKYDSIYLSPRQQQMAAFSHQYLTRQPRQYQWQYDVEYNYTHFNEWSAQKVICQNCKVAVAKFYCSQDRESYCEPCFGDLHRSQKKYKHQKQSLNPFNCPPRCQKSLHQNEPLTHYCFSCKHLKCSNCLSDGHHKWKNIQSSSNGKTLHDTLESRQLAFLLKEKQKQINSEVKLKMTGMIRQIQSKIQVISAHYDMRVKEFLHWFQEKTAAARQIAIEELNLATGLHSELKRKYDEVLWLQNFSRQMEERCNAEAGMQIKEGITIYVNRAFSQEYFQKLQKKIQDIKIFN